MESLLGPRGENVANITTQTAIDPGVNWIDTAPFYSWGRAEQVVGKAIKGRRDEVHIFTKCGTLPDVEGGWSENLKPESIRRDLRESLQRLQTDYVDLYQFHDPDPRTPIEESWREGNASSTKAKSDTEDCQTIPRIWSRELSK